LNQNSSSLDCLPSDASSLQDSINQFSFEVWKFHAMSRNRGLELLCVQLLLKTVNEVNRVPKVVRTCHWLVQ
jgi:hypothetical protein